MRPVILDSIHKRIRKKSRPERTLGASVKRALKMWAAFVLVGGLLLIPLERAFAEENGASAGKLPEVIDCTDDQFSYGELVARLNRGEVPKAAKGLLTAQSVDGENAPKRGRTLTAVLCRTDGTEPDFEPWAPDYVIAGPDHCYTLYFSTEESADKAAAELSGLPGIRYAERDAEVEACETETVSLLSWGAERMNFGPYLSWAAGCSSGSATVAVVDSGSYRHSMYSSRIQESGYDYVDGDEDATSDLYGHGTNVAGIVADCTQNLPVYLYPIRVLNAEGKGSVSNTVNGIREAVRKGVDVINLSLACESISGALDNAILDAVNAGVTVVAAAGNNKMDVSTISPGHLTDPGVLIVGSAETDGTKSSYSNYGESVDVYTYGSVIKCCSKTGEYAYNTGTSMAAPHVSGLAAVLALTHTGITPQETETRICNSTDAAQTINISDLTRITPDNMGFSLNLLRMDLQDSYRLGTSVRPVTATEPIQYQISDPTVVSVQEGQIVPLKPGTATIMAQSLGLEDQVFDVIVTDEECMTVTLPQNLRTIGEEAFSGAAGIVGHMVLPETCETVGAGAFLSCEGLKTIELPDSPVNIEDGAFSDTVLLCREGSMAESWAREHQQPYILLYD